MYLLNEKDIERFLEYLIREEKSRSTIEKYIHDVTAFKQWSQGKEIDKMKVLSYKEILSEKYAPASVNAALSSLNAFFNFMEWFDLRVKALKIQRRIYSDSNTELTKVEYERLLSAAKSKGNERLYFLMQAICSTGMRVSEVKFMTVESLNLEYVDVKNKGKNRRVFLPKELCCVLKKYCRKRGIVSGSVFITKNGKNLDRTNIWADMKKLCKDANVSDKKVFPHNLRHLFARTYYSLQKDIVRLADILGHSSIDTTRIYTIEDGEIHKKQIQKLGLLRRW